MCIPFGKGFFLSFSIYLDKISLLASIFFFFYMKAGSKIQALVNLFLDLYNHYPISTQIKVIMITFGSVPPPRSNPYCFLKLDQFY